MRLACALFALLVGCGDRGDGVPVLGDTGAEGGLADVGCPSGQSMCGARCTDVLQDSLNCGACGVICPTTYTCAAGTCAPATPLQ